MKAKTKRSRRHRARPKLSPFARQLSRRSRVLRAWLGWTQAKLASVLGVGRNTVNRLERGRVRTQESTLARLEILERRRKEGR